MLIVYKFGPAFGLPDASPFVLKLETWLRMAGLPYRTERGDTRKAPKGKIPYLADGDRLIGDSSHIIDYLREKHGDPLKDGRFDARKRAMGRATKSLFESELYFILLYLRWWNDDDFEIYRPVLKEFLGASGVPSLVQPAIVSFIRRSSRGQAEAQGIGRHAREEVYAMGRSLLEAASDLLGDQPYFLDDAPSTLDATAYGMLTGIMKVPFESPVKAAALDRANLVSYCERMRERFWA